jgi:hypothetical protein
MGLMARLFGGKARRRLDEILAGRAVHRLDDVLGFGVKSRGKAQIRGNGWLALTSDELIFVMWLPVRDVRIPRSAVLEAGTVKSWLGKTVGARLLHVRWEEDEAAWQVRDIESWLGDLNAWRAAG